MRSRLGACVVMAIAVAAPALGTLAFAGPASALTGAACAKLVSTTSNPSTGTLSSCTDPANTGGGGKITSTVSGSTGTGTITWNTRHGTTTTSFTFTVVSAKGCPAGYTIAATEKGSVTGGTGAAIKSIPVGQASSAKVCVDTTTNKVILFPRTKFVV